MSASQIIRDHVNHHLALVIDNDEALRNEVVEAATEAVVNDMGTGFDVDEYEMMIDGGRGQLRRDDFAEAAGSRIADVMIELLDRKMPNQVDPLRLILGALLDFGDSQQWTGLGDHFLPDADDVRTYMGL